MCDANPIFSKTRFLARYGEGHCSPDLTTTMVAVTAKITNMVQSIDRSKLDTCIDMLLTSSLQDDVMISDYASLDQFRKACILAFYEFHQFPGHQAWMRIGRLARIAYRVGLDRLESLRSLYYDWNTIEEEDMQEWRSIWWCIYRLDSYSNIASGTPYVVEDNLFSTSLFVAQTHMSPNGNITAGDLRLPPRSQGFWSIIPDILLDSENALMNIHNVTVAAMRQAGSMARVYFLRSKEESTAYTADLEQQISALRLALPTHWFSPRRNAFLRESQDAQHGRLVTVLHLLMAQLILSAIICTQGQSENWLVAWERVLETCQDIASVAANWDSAFCLKVDPAVAFVSFTALIMLELHRKSSALSDPNLESKIRSDQTALRLQLNHFAKVWMLPKLLTLSFESFAESIPDRLPEEDVVRILSRFEAPLHPRWLQFLSSAHIIPEIV
ncbi:hypothetical protein BKA67DRAFT_209314 [Truncatella angustata]|uniref:Xylanolytic transcriptional activator regulatory domain-containing protein n=1 Tax=Truncatella angustata TaxID=152316 RepID=A0A9P8UTW1_9PEZI|nr:uncharacterized protein BKA67DRAFT_209314 [Truncatella angustata]KAH6658241.1 hypothetical protein BKA67DRAFT_209314 [Truncatella angustata]